jgi:hypothetical protein
MTTLHLEEQLLILLPVLLPEEQALARPDRRQVGAGGGEAGRETILDFFFT